MKNFKEYSTSRNYLDRVNEKNIREITRNKEPELNTQDKINNHFDKLESEIIKEISNKNHLEENIDRRVRPKMEYISQTKRLLRNLRNETGDDKIDVLGELIGLSIQLQLFGYK